MNLDAILSRIPSLNSPKEGEDEEGDALSAAKAKAERVKFHRAKVRCGPAKFSAPTNGQLRRERHRALKNMTKRARRTQIREYLEIQNIAASTRGQLQLAGVLPFHTPRTLDLTRQAKSAIWIIDRFGKEGEDGKTSYAHGDVLLALAAALEFYGKVIGDETLQVPEGYVVPVYETKVPA